MTSLRCGTREVIQMGESDDNELTIGEMCGLLDLSPVLLERAIADLVQRGLIEEVKRENDGGDGKQRN